VELVFFYILAAGALLGALLLVCYFRNPVYGAISLIFTLLNLSGLFVLLDAHFLAAIQVMVYAGAIMVLFLFVTMLLNLQEDELGGPRYGAGKLLAVVGVAFLTWQLAVVLMRDSGPVPGFDVKTLPAAQMETFGTVEQVGRLLFGDFLVPFELTSVLILAAIVASVVIAKKRI
jgi:NADH-quinone oxidoreductase subunit J